MRPHKPKFPLQAIGHSKEPGRLIRLVWLCMAVGFMAMVAPPLYGLATKVLGVERLDNVIGAQIDELDGVAVYYNGPIKNVSGRNTAPDGYNLGQKYQCVEFVKRYYYEALGHKMPNPWGHAKDFFNLSLADGALNADRGLNQFRNGGKSRPQHGDLVVMKGGGHGHVGIISEVREDYAEMVQQNPGPDKPSRIRIPLKHYKIGGQDNWSLEHPRVLGWLRKK